MSRNRARQSAASWLPLLLAVTIAGASSNAFAAGARTAPLRLHATDSVNWPQTFHDGGHTSYNPSESILSPSNVGTLQLVGGVGVTGGPLAFTLDNGILFSQGQGDGVHPNLVAINTRNGATIWSSAAPPTSASSTMAAGQGLVFVNCLLSPTSNPYQGVCAYNQRTGTLAWSFGNQQQGGDDITPLTYANGVVYLGYGLVIGGITFQPGITALNAATGQPLYLANVGGTGSNALNGTPPVVGGGYVYYSCNLNNISGVCAFSAATGQLAWQYNNGTGTIALTYGGGVLIAHADNNGACSIVALNGANGKALASFNYQAGCGSPYPVAVANGMLYASNTAGNLFALSGRTGQLAWSASPDNFASAPAVANGVVYIQLSYADAPTTIAYSAKNGAQLWAANEGGDNLGTPPVIANGVLFAAGTSCGSICAYTLPRMR